MEKVDITGVGNDLEGLLGDRKLLINKTWFLQPDCQLKMLFSYDCHLPATLNRILKLSAEWDTKILADS